MIVLIEVLGSMFAAFLLYLVLQGLVQRGPRPTATERREDEEWADTLDHLPRVSAGQVRSGSSKSKLTRAAPAPLPRPVRTVRLTGYWSHGADGNLVASRKAAEIEAWALAALAA